MSNRYIQLFLFFLLLSQGAFAKPKIIRKSEMDSLKKVATIHRHMRADSIRSNVVQVVYSLGYADTLLDQLDKMHSTLNQITNESKYGFKTQQIENELQDMKKGIGVIDASLGRDSTVLNISNLQMFRGLLKDMEVNLADWRASLYKNNSELSRMTDEMKEFAQDSFAQKVAADTAFANLHLDEMLILQDKWHEGKKSTHKNLEHISKLMADVSTTYFNVTELENVVNNELAGAVNKTFGKEYGFIWDSQVNYKFKETTAITAESYQERMQILGYYLRLNAKDWLAIPAIGLIFLIWVFRNFRRIKLTGSGTPVDISLTYIRPFAIVSALIVTLNVAPFYGLNQPAIFVEMVLLVLLIPLTILFLRVWRGQFLLFWCLLAGFYILTCTMNAIITPGLSLRLFMLGVNICAIIYGISFFKLYKKDPRLGHLLKWFIVLFVLMHIAAIFANLSGRVTLGRIFTSSAIKGLTQIIALSVTVRILIEAFYLQMQSTRISGGQSATFDFEKIRSNLYKLLTMTAIILWLVTFCTNLDIYPSVLAFLNWLLNTPRNIGSTSFTIGNVLTFIFVLYMVNILQQYIGYFFGETDGELVVDPDKNQSRLVIFRLIIIMTGFFIAVVASGLPVDKVTVVLGALGVGIGLGLQNIVYNLVSGLVLIFEKPMEIGDYVEVGDKKGRVQNIGIRSSTLRTAEGSEVIVPNGDFLSTHMVNWTRGNDNRRAELSIGIEPASELDSAKESIVEELKASTFVIHERPVEILLSNLTEKSVTLVVYVWINSIYKEEEFKSELIAKIHGRLAAKGIRIV